MTAKKRGKERRMHTTASAWPQRYPKTPLPMCYSAYDEHALGQRSPQEQVGPSTDHSQPFASTIPKKVPYHSPYQTFLSTRQQTRPHTTAHSLNLAKSSCAEADPNFWTLLHQKGMECMQSCLSNDVRFFPYSIARSQPEISAPLRSRCSRICRR